MGIFKRIVQRVSQKSTFYNAPIISNGDQYTNLPDPGPGLQGDYRLNPGRVHAPSKHLKTSMDHLDEGSADPAIHRYPDTPSTQYYKETKQIPRPPVEVPANGVFVPDPDYGLGWKQGFVPARGMRAALETAAPPPMLDMPIVEVVINTGLQGKRTPVKLKAPKPYRRDD